MQKNIEQHLKKLKEYYKNKQKTKPIQHILESDPRNKTSRKNIPADKLNKIIDDLEINSAKLNIDMSKEKVANIVNLSSFLANGSGARGTPTFFINEEFVVGYISIDRIKALLNE